jgi:hypothetical protein
MYDRHELIINATMTMRTYVIYSPTPQAENDHA